MTRQLYCIYSPAFDRFIITANQNLFEIDELVATKIIPSHEYFRYLPDIGITLKDIDGYLRSKPSEMCLEITKKCNLQCPVCISDSQIRSSRELSFEKVNEIMKSNPRLNMPRVTLTGGEPTLHNDFFKILQLIGSEGRNVILSTNGYFPSKLELAVSSIDNIIIATSLHGTEEVHDSYVKCRGAFKKVLQSIEIATGYHKSVHVYSVVTQELLNSLPQICDLLSKFSISELRLNMIKPHGRINSLQITHRSYENAFEVLKSLIVPFRVQIKRREQPFLFINCLGDELIHD